MVTIKSGMYVADTDPWSTASSEKDPNPVLVVMQVIREGFLEEDTSNPSPEGNKKGKNMRMSIHIFVNIYNDRHWCGHDNSSHLVSATRNQALGSYFRHINFFNPCK